ncbi:MAG TPA: DMT family transporter [Alphaproteobacteria bacterium]|nr:DMT family transporter [Alphaproteobacteria bacterium]
MALAMIFVLILGSIWGFATTASKLALEGYSLMTVVFWYIFIAFVVLLAIVLVRRTLPPLDWVHLRYYLFNGLIGLTIPAFNNMLVLPHVPAGVMSTVIATAPLFTYVLALLANQEGFVPIRAVGVLTGFVGVLCVVLPAGSLPSPEVAGWVALGLLTPFLYGLNAVFASRFMPPGTDSLALATGLLGVAVLVFGLSALASGEATGIWPPVWPSWYGLVWMGIASSAAYVLYFQIIRMAGPVYMSQVGYVVVTVGVLAGMAVFGERHSFWVWLGIGLMLAGVTLLNIGQRLAMKRA